MGQRGPADPVPATVAPESNAVCARSDGCSHGIHGKSPRIAHAHAAARHFPKG